MSDYIYLSPHLDDAVFSCGAILWDQIHQQHKTVEIWTIFAGDEPQGELSLFASQIHARWNTGANAARVRRSEDQLACERLGVNSRHLHYADCIYRHDPQNGRYLIENNEYLFQGIHPSELPLIDEISQFLKQNLPESCKLILPLGVGGHMDHLITRQAAEKINRPIYYYADFPYAGAHLEEISTRIPPQSKAYHFPINNVSLARWQYAVEAYTSQLSSFWPSLSQMYKAIEKYAQSPLGNCLWKSPTDIL